MEDWLEQLLEQAGQTQEAEPEQELDPAWGRRPAAPAAPTKPVPAGEPEGEGGGLRGEDGPPDRPRPAQLHGEQALPGQALSQPTPPAQATPAPSRGGALEEVLGQTVSVLLPPEAGPAPASQPGAPGPRLPGQGTADRAGSGLELLYRQVQAAAWRENAVQQAGVAVVRESALPQPGLTMGQMDRALRRDSRRYDGGMSIY